MVFSLALFIMAIESLGFHVSQYWMNKLADLISVISASSQPATLDEHE